MYPVVFLETAWKELQRLPSPVQRRIERAIDALAGVPRPPGCTKLAGEEDLYRIRVGDYRVIYQLRDDRLLVVVVRVGPRGSVYRP